MNIQLWISLLVALFPFVAACAASGYQSFLHSLPANRAGVIANVVSQVVHGVEQLANSGQLDPEERKQEAEASITAILSHWGIKLPPAYLDKLIEDVVFSLPASNLPIEEPVPAPAPANVVAMPAPVSALPQQ